MVDILVREPSGKVFDVEMQNKVGTSIAKRARYYLSLVNTKMLRPGQGFDQLSGSVVIFICAHDPFGRGWKRYNFRRTCAQDGMELDDGTEIVFINAEGTKGNVGPELDAFIRYIRDATMVESDYVRTVDAAVREVRDDPVWRGIRMLWSEKYRDDFAEARREGRKLGLEEGRTEGREQGRTEGLEQGRAESLASISQLASQLEAAGRTDELLSALRNPERLKELLREFDIPA